MITHKLLLWFLAAALIPAWAAPKMPRLILTVPPEIEANGITLVLATDQGAQQEVGKQAGADLKLVEGALPIGVVLVNNGPNRLLQTTVRFKFMDGDGNPHDWYFNQADFNAVPPSQVSANGGTRLFLPHRGLINHFATPEDATHKRGSLSPFADTLMQLIDDFSKVETVNVSIDSVTIEGIGLVGPDAGDMRSTGQDRKTVQGAK